MATPKALVLTGFGINCDKETYGALKKAGADAELVHLNDLIDGSRHLKNYQMLVFPGGFSFGDDISAGKVFAATMKANLEEKIIDFIMRDKLTFGFCNGFQIMVKMGLLPGVGENGSNYYRNQTATLAANDSNQYEDRWIHLMKPEEQPKDQKDKCVLARGIDIIYLPVAHGEGKFFAPEGVIKKIEESHLVVFRYAVYSDKTGEDQIPKLVPANGLYPENPNGSINDIAGICDSTGRIFGMMPHPERFQEFTNHPDWTMIKEALKKMKLPIPEEGEGMKMFRNAVEYFK